VTPTTGDAGADTLPRGLQLLAETFSFSKRARPMLGFGHYATIIDTGGPQALALATDTIGTKALIAQALGRYDTAGIDCVAMNANDIVCVGAEPIAMVDCMAVEEMDEEFLTEIAVGLREGARRAHISIAGGETAHIPEMLQGAVPGRAFDLGGTCAGLVEPDQILMGREVQPGNALVGFASSGIHSNGFTLARRTFREAGWDLDQYVDEFERGLGEELLEPTTMYVDLAMKLLLKLEVRALFHMTGGGFLNLRRLEAAAGFNIEKLPPVPAIFSVIQSLAKLDDAAMYAEYNMGAGFCAVVPQAEVDRAIALGKDYGIQGWQLGTATASVERQVQIHADGIHLKSTPEGFIQV